MSKILQIILAAVLFVPFPIVFERGPDGSFVFGVYYAYTDKGGDDDDDDDDNSGRGNQNDDDDENKGSNNSGSGNANSNNGGSSSNNSGGQGAVADLHLRYPNGWDEQIRNGQYRLIDPDGRTVSNRRATHEDLARMRALVGQ